MLSLTCKRAAALLSASLERSLPLGERLLLRLHLRVCSACARYKRQLQLLRSVIRQRARRSEEQTGPDVPALTPDARDRLKRSLQRGSSGGPVELKGDETA
jgi:predicted anti-sigma-YlaC factor YlaD